MTPVHVDFGELFAQEDTIRLDSSVLIGGSWSLDVNSQGELLVHDNQSGGVYVFSPAGALVRTMAITDCNPEATLGFGTHSSFLGDGRVAVLHSKGVIIFDQAGKCVQAITDAELATNTSAICLREDTTFAMPRAVRDSTYIRAYGRDFTLIGQFQLAAPNFLRRAAVMLLYPGRTMACFNDDVWWVYGESFDATPRLRHTGLTQFRPDFYIERKEDYPELPLVDQSNWQRVGAMLSKAEAEASSVRGMFALDNETRLVVYDNISTDNRELSTGAVIASHEGRFPGVSTLFSKFPNAATNGMLYFASDPEDQPGGEVTNPIVVRYRFIPPTDQ